MKIFAMNKNDFKKLIKKIESLKNKIEMNFIFYNYIMMNNIFFLSLFMCIFSKILLCKWWTIKYNKLIIIFNIFNLTKLKNIKKILKK